MIQPEFNYQQRKRFFAHLKLYYWEEPILYKHCVDQVIRRCVSEQEMESILNHFHTLACGGHFGGQRTTIKVLQSGFYWLSLFKDSHQFASTLLVINANKWGVYKKGMSSLCKSS